MARKIRFQMNQVKFHSLGLQERDLKFNKGSLHLCTRYVSSSTKKSLKKDSSPRPLRYCCNAITTKLSSQLGAGHFVTS